MSIQINCSVLKLKAEKCGLHAKSGNKAKMPRECFNRQIKTNSNIENDSVIECTEKERGSLIIMPCG